MTLCRLSIRELDLNQDHCGRYRLHPSTLERAVPHRLREAAARGQFIKCDICASHSHKPVYYADKSMNEISIWMKCQVCGNMTEA